MTQKTEPILKIENPFNGDCLTFSTEILYVYAPETNEWYEVPITALKEYVKKHFKPTKK